MKELKIDKEFESLIPPLTSDEFKQLEANIIADGCRDALVAWNDVIIDGHNRYKICGENQLDFRVEEKDLDCREDAVIWICQNQRGRRNVTEQQKAYLLGKEYQAIKKKWGGADYSDKKTSSQIGNSKPIRRTGEILAKQHGVGHGTVTRSDDFAKGVDAIAAESIEAKQKILSGESKISKTEIQEISKKPKEEIKKMAKEIESNTYASPRAPRNNNATKEYKEMEAKLLDFVTRPDPVITPDSKGDTLAINIENYARYIDSMIPSQDIAGQFSIPIKEKIIASIATIENTMTILKKIIKETTTNE